MKSVIEEASSLEKAIEQGWIKAGKPKEFSVKIFQESIKNFLGMSKQTAKVGIFFKEGGNATEPANYQDRNRPQQRRPYRGNRPNNAAANANNPNNPANKNRRPQTNTPNTQTNSTTSTTNEPTVTAPHDQVATARPDGTPAPKRYHRPRRPYQGTKPNASTTNQPNYAGHDENIKKSQSE